MERKITEQKVVDVKSVSDQESLERITKFFVDFRKLKWPLGCLIGMQDAGEDLKLSGFDVTDIGFYSDGLISLLTSDKKVFREYYEVSSYQPRGAHEWEDYHDKHFEKKIQRVYLPDSGISLVDVPVSHFVKKHIREFKSQPKSLYILSEREEEYLSELVERFIR